MSSLEHNSQVLRKYIPSPSVYIVAQWIEDLNVKLSITRSRNTKLGDYRAPNHLHGHRITINHDLNPYQFLITLIHEMAHLVTWNRHRDKVLPHGQEWKREFSRMMSPFLHEVIFPSEILPILKKHLADPNASSCSDEQLYRVLMKYNNRPTANGTTAATLIEQLRPGTLFQYGKQGQTFRLIEKVRKRYLCIHQESGARYFFSALAEVSLIPE